MKHLKKEMVKTVIEHANACPASSDFSPEEIRKAIQSGGKGLDPKVDAFNGYIRSIGDNASAELMALMSLGRDQSLKADQWNKLVQEALRNGPRDLLAAPKGRIGQWLRTGMERLARANKLQRKTNGTPTAAPKKSEESDSVSAVGSTGDEGLREVLAGRYVLNSFMQQYGEEDGLRKLGRFMVAAGHLKKTEHLAVFGLKPQDFHGALEAVLSADTTL